MFDKNQYIIYLPLSYLQIYRPKQMNYNFTSCFIWLRNLPLNLREENRLEGFQNKVLKIFGPTREEMTGGWKKLHNEELHICIHLYLMTVVIR
jgi:hypothetical protein